MKKIINIDNWDRKEQFLYFREFAQPYINVTCMVDCRHIKSIAKKREQSFFLHYLYCILKTANNIDEFKYRIDNDGNVVFYDRINALAPIRLPGMKTYATMRIEYNENFDEFYENAKKVIDNADKFSPFEIQKSQKEVDVVLVSAIPRLPFTSISITHSRSEGRNYPIFTIGKLGDDMKMPVALRIHHGFVDGDHLADFYEMLQRNLNNESIFL